MSGWELGRLGEAMEEVPAEGMLVFVVPPERSRERNDMYGQKSRDLEFGYGTRFTSFF
jgi:hypothetical protein